MIPSQHNKNRRKGFLKTKIAFALAASLTYPMQLQADATGKMNVAPLKPDMPYIFVVHNGRSIKIQRDIDDSYKARMDIRGTMIQSADSCPPFCLQPQNLDMPVETVGEIEIVDFMMTKLRDGSGVLVDIRSKKSYEYSTIPGSVNYFVQLIQQGLGDEEFEKMLMALGAEKRKDVNAFDKALESIGLKDTSMLTDDWDFTEAKELVIWSNSAIEGAPVIAIENLLAAGYPETKLKWYRGGMASWQYWGFTTYKKRR